MLNRSRIPAMLAWLAAVVLLAACTSGGGDDSGNTGTTNNAPVAVDQGVTTAEDTATTIALTANDTDLDTLTYSIVGPPTHGTLSAVSGNGLTYSPNLNFNGSDSLTFRANDGAANSNTATVTITVTPVNDQPVATPQGVTLDEDTSTTIALTATDADVDTLTYAIVTAPTNGTLGPVTGNTVKYTPAANYNGSDTFSFLANDGSVASNQSTVTITVTSVNDPVLAGNDAATVAEDSTATAINVLANDSTAPDAGETLSITAVTQGAKGAVTHTANNVSYMPNANVNGADSFTYTVSDGNGSSVTATVSMTITSVNDSPVAASQDVETPQDTQGEITLTATDAENDSLIYSIEAPPTHGTLNGVAPTLTYTPSLGYTGPDSFTFRANDGLDDSNIATVSITVTSSGPLTGRFVDGPVEGLHYQTQTGFGSTNANGEFQYLNGETVRFFVGDILVGQAAGKPTISPFDLAGATAPQSGADIHLALTRARNLRQPTPFEVAANVALFLQTLDDDGDPSNGIQLPAQIHALATGVSVNFNQKLAGFTENFNQEVAAFSEDLAFRTLISDGRDAGLWGGARGIQRPADALDALYAGLGLVPSIAAPTLTTIDIDADATLDQRTTYSHNAAGRPTMVEVDADADGAVDQRTTYSYDAIGRLSSEAVDTDANNSADQLTTYTYDVNGNLTLVEVDADGDGFVDLRTTTIYDEVGSVTQVEVDTGADGSVEQRYLYGYDTGGHETLVAVDFDGDGNVDQRQLYTYNANGQRTAFEFDMDGNNSVDQRTSYTYDASGNRTIEAFDAGADGTVDQRTTNSYDGNGQLTQTAVDFDGDNVVDKRTVYSHDANGNETLFELDVDNNGTFESRTETTYDVNGSPTTVEGDANGDGTADSRTTFSYDANGNLTLKTTDNNADGTVDGRVQTTWTVINRWGAIL